MKSIPRKLCFCLHGLAVGLRCNVPLLDGAIGRLAEPFQVSELPEGFVPTEGTILPYDADEVARHLSPTAVRFPVDGDGMEIYCENERFWLIDDRFGLVEVNLLKGHWRAWILPAPTIEPYRIVEMAVLWPLAQLLRSKGLSLLPAVSVARDGWGMLLISPMNLEPEIAALMRAGFRLVGQHWTGLREEDGRIAMLHVPGQIQKSNSPRASGSEMGWVDLSANHPGATANHAFCDAVVLIEPGRRPISWARRIGQVNAIPALRRCWPIIELHPQRRQGRLIPRLAVQSKLFEMRLSRDPKALLGRLDAMRYGGAPVDAQKGLTSSATRSDPATSHMAIPVAAPQLVGNGRSMKNEERAITGPIQTTVRPLRAGWMSDPAPPRNLTPWSLAG